jgi:hypothetical protein
MRATMMDREKCDEAKVPLGYEPMENPSRLDNAKCAAPRAKEDPLDEAERWTSLHHPRYEGQSMAMDSLRPLARNLIEGILRLCPSNADRSAAVRKAREALQAAIASIVVPQ